MECERYVDQKTVVGVFTYSLLDSGMGIRG